MKTLLGIAAFLLIAAVTITACTPAPDAEIVIYSGRREQFVQPLVDRFEAETGIKVRMLSGNATQYAHRIIEEKNNPQADLFIANDAGIMEYLRLAGVLQANNDSALTVIPAQFRAADGSWLGLSARSRVLMFNPDLISEGEMPQTMADLVDPRFGGQFAITRAGNAAMISHIAALRAVWGDQETELWLKAVLANEPLILSGHTDIRHAVGSGEIAFGLVNNYYYHLQLDEAANNNVAAIYPDQGVDQMGAFVNIAGVALVKDARNTEAARQFIRFLLEAEQQEVFAMESMETPLVPGIPVTAYGLAIDAYKHMQIKLDVLGPVWEDTVDLMERAGYAD